MFYQQFSVFIRTKPTISFTDYSINSDRSVLKKWQGGVDQLQKKLWDISQGWQKVFPCRVRLPVCGKLRVGPGLIWREISSMYGVLFVVSNRSLVGDLQWHLAESISLTVQRHKRPGERETRESWRYSGPSGTEDCTAQQYAYKSVI